MLTSAQVVELLGQEREFLAREFGVRRIALFGSFAAGCPTEESDVDLLVEFDRPIGLGFVELAEHLERVLGRRVDLVTAAGLAAIPHPSVARSIAESLVHV
ncbi:nucleotidyltransferase family protein [Acidobacteria bacterium ACD]|nr:MAG: nucleotidyltransferase [Acidobacteriota bacterium]MCE7958492.1 nucleotidyltransferase [Acidobacteria bacterium ACB2]MDL1950301.1 nucleotidyltransferase family protein [Acidobacteria bacterium ACD]